MGLNPEYPKVTAIRPAFESPWFSILGKKVDITPSGDNTYDYLALSCPDFACTCARTGNGLIVLVRQYRPVVERYTWEFPAGMVDPREFPQEAANREFF